MKTDLLQLRLSASEKDSFQRAADVSGIVLSAWVRERLRTAARKELVEVGEQVPFLQEKVSKNG